MTEEAIDRLEPGHRVFIGTKARTVRAIHLKTDRRGTRKYYFYFAILKPSWTNRPYVVFTRPDLRRAAVSPSYLLPPVRVDGTCLERRVLREIEEGITGRRYATAQEVIAGGLT